MGPASNLPDGFADRGGHLTIREVLVKPIVLAFVALSLCLSGGVVHAAKLRCDYDRSKDKDEGFERAKDERGKTRKGFYVDRFTEELVVETKWMEIGSGNTYGSIATRARGDDRFLQLFITHRWSKKTMPTDEDTESNFSIVPGTKVLVGMADGSVLTLESATAVDAETTYETPKPRSGLPFWITSSAAFEILLDDAATAVLATTQSKALRVVTDTGNIDLRIEGRDQDGSVQNLVRCVTEGGS